MFSSGQKAKKVKSQGKKYQVTKMKSLGFVVSNNGMLQVHRILSL
jgi:hypothetical protein